MKLMPQTTTATELQRNYRKVVEKVKKLGEPVVVLSRSEPELVVMDYKVFSHLQQNRIDLQKGRHKGLDELFGSWTKKEAEEFNSRIDEMFEQVDPEMWR